MTVRFSTKDSTAADPLERALREEARVIEDQLAKDPRRKRLEIIRRTLDDLGNLNGSQPKSLLGNNVRRASSIGLGARYALDDTGHPLPLAKLLEAMRPYGKMPGGEKPSWNLSNTLSADDRFVGVVWKGEKCWWLATKPVPPE